MTFNPEFCRHVGCAELDKMDGRHEDTSLFSEICSETCKATRVCERDENRKINCGMCMMANWRHAQCIYGLERLVMEGQE